MDTARSAFWLLLWFKTLIPWILIGIGAVLVISPLMIVGYRKVFGKAAVQKPADIARPTSLPMDS
jgi:uncharacterized SAM-binding protein YcdF (DUF218 family)